MRYFSYYAPDFWGDMKIITVSEKDIKAVYYQVWEKRMTAKYGHDKGSTCFENCLNEWIIENCAWENTLTSRFGD